MIPFLVALDADDLAPKAQAAAMVSHTLIAQAPEPTVNAPSSNRFPYASLQLGVGFPNSYDGSFNLAGSSVNTSIDLNTGFNGELALGYQFNQARAEIAVGYGNYDSQGQSFGGGTRIGSNGELQVTTVMLNGYYDIPIYNSDGFKSRWSPYLGAGIGYANINAPACKGTGCFSGGSTDGFAYQGKVGISYRFAERSFAFLEGGYLGATSGSSIDGVDFDNFGTWRLNVGFRIGFGGAPKPKPAAKIQEVQSQPPITTPESMPAPAPQQTMPIRGLW
jgi:OmpA-OmpF porin, OOP family